MCLIIKVKIYDICYLTFETAYFVLNGTYFLKKFCLWMMLCLVFLKLDHHIFVLQAHNKMHNYTIHWILMYSTITLIVQDL